MSSRNKKSPGRTNSAPRRRDSRQKEGNRRLKGILSFLKKGVYALFGLFLVGGGYAFFHFEGDRYLRDRVWAFIEEVSQKKGVQLNHIIVEGRYHVTTQDISKTLAARKGMTLFALDVHDIRQRLVNLPWVRAAIVQRRFPDTLYVNLTERKPIALWQNASKISVIDDQGKEIEGVSAAKFQKLLSVSGEAAPQHAPEIIRQLRDVPTVRARLHGAVLNGGRHWDLLVRNGPRVKLPEEGVDEALKYLENLMEKGHLDNPKIKSIDVRLQDRTFFYLEDGEAKKHQKTFAKKGKA